MIARDIVNKVDVEVDTKKLIELMNDGRQVDFILEKAVSDDDGYLTWDVEHWSSLKKDKFVRTYELEGRTLRDFTHFNIYDMATEFNPERAKTVQIS